MKRLGMLLGTVAVAALLVGCGSGSTSDSSTTHVTAGEKVRFERQQILEAARASIRTGERRSEAAAIALRQSHKEAAERKATKETRQRMERALAEFEQEEAEAEPAPTRPGEVSKAEFGGKWPLTVSHGTLDCDGSNGVGDVTFTDPQGFRYAVNGLALQEGLPEITPIWRFQPGMAKYELRVDMGPLIDRGLALCR